MSHCRYYAPTEGGDESVDVSAIRLHWEKSHVA